LYQHQADAIRRARAGRNYVLTTGTGSGKSLAYIVPIVDHVLRNGSSRGIQAIVVYPMNALANSQFGELQKFLQLGYPDGKGPVTFARYTGQERDEERNAILDTFPIVRRKDEAEQGEYRTKRTILEIYDAMSEAEQTGRPYQTRLSPPPADVTVAHRAVVEETQTPPRILVGDRALLPNDAWATPLGVAPENVSLFALIDVLRLIGGEIDPQKVRIAAILVRKPALAAAFMDDAQAKEWSRLVGREARPLKGNVIQISHFQQGAADLPWADAISQLKGSGGLVVASGKWSAGDRLPLSSGQDWISGRASVAVQLLGAITPEDAEQGVIAFIRSVEDGTARRAIS
jgi:DEAD/DEAH box helicase